MKINNKKSGQKKQRFSMFLSPSSLEFGRLYPNIGETTTKNTVKDRNYGKEKTFGEFFSLAKRTF